MEAQLPRFRSEPPVRAWPLVQPRAKAAPMAMRAPPTKAKARRVPTETRGPFSTVFATRPARRPEMRAPTKAPAISKTSQASRGCVPSSRYAERNSFDFA
jgi:hypothetical protein